jgi:hypothetical protein
MNGPSTRKNDPFLAQPADGAIPPGIDRRTFIIRNAVIGAAAAMTGATWTREARAAQAAKEAGTPKLGPGPSSSHTIGPILDRLYDRDQRNRVTSSR